MKLKRQTRFEAPACLRQMPLLPPCHRLTRQQLMPEPATMTELGFPKSVQQIQYEAREDKKEEKVSTRGYMEMKHQHNVDQKEEAINSNLDELAISLLEVCYR